MNKAQYISFSLLLTSFSLIAQAQLVSTGEEQSRNYFQAKQVIAPSPEAAELGKYGNVPISLFTGTPQVSIPLLELKGRVLSCPVSLSYNSSGFKPSEIAPWTGLSWALNAGGIITRSAMGDPDMDDNYFVSPSPVHAVPTGNAFELQKRQYLDSVTTKKLETQPDVYYYNFMGHSGRFYVTPEGTVVKKEKNFLSISYSPGSFTIFDERGISYQFDSLEVTTSYPLNDLPGMLTSPTRTFTSAWYLTTVSSPYGGEELLIDYHVPSFSQSNINGSLLNKSISYTRTNDGSPTWFLGSTSGATYTSYAPAISIKKKFLKKITLTKNSETIGYIDFESGVNERDDLGDVDFNGERILKKIKLFSVQNGGADTSLIKQFDLGFGYFGATQAESPGYYRRLKLKQVQEVSPDTVTTPSKPPYVFSYYGENAQMPGRYTTGLDHWAFFNGAANPYGLVPSVVTSHLGQMNETLLAFSADRSSNKDSAMLTVLKEVLYPTGGSTSFEYEGNQIPDPASLPVGIKEIGGVRIKKMIDLAFPDRPALVKTYEYMDGGDTTSSGHAEMPIYYQNSKYEFRQGCPGQPDYDKYIVTVSASSVFGLGSLQGSHIGYNRVTERRTDPVTNETTGKTVYHYHIETYAEINDKIGSGDLEKQEIFDSTGNLLEEFTNEYDYVYFDDSVYVTSRRLVAAATQSSNTILYTSTGQPPLYYDANPCVTIAPGYTSTSYSVPAMYDYADDYISEQSRQLKEQTRKVFDIASGAYITTTKKFTYGNPLYNYPTLTEERNSLNEKIFTAVKYVGDYVLPCPPHTLTQLGTMKLANMHSFPVETLVYKKDSLGNNTRYISGRYVEAEYGQPRRIFFLKTKPLLSSVTASTDTCGGTGMIIDANYQLEAVMAYDGDMNLIEETKVNDITTTYFWDHQNVYPVAKLTNALYGASAYSSFEADGTGNWDYSLIGCRADSGSVTGKKAYFLSAANIERTALDTAKTYLVTYWLKSNGGSASVNGSGPGTLLTERNGWKLYQREVSNDSTVSISGTGIIDELRLFPKNAQMKTFTYEPVVGITSQCDENNRIIYYEYDLLNRLIRIRDQDRNILKTYEYRYQQTQ